MTSLSVGLCGASRNRPVGTASGFLGRQASRRPGRGPRFPVRQEPRPPGKRGSPTGRICRNCGKSATGRPDPAARQIHRPAVLAAANAMRNLLHCRRLGQFFRASLGAIARFGPQLAPTAYRPADPAACALRAEHSARRPAIPRTTIDPTNKVSVSAQTPRAQQLSGLQSCGTRCVRRACTRCTSLYSTFDFSLSAFRSWLRPPGRLKSAVGKVAARCWESCPCRFNKSSPD